MKHRFFKINCLLLALGILFLALENTFYQNVDKNGYLHESLFLPFGAILIMCGVLGFLVMIIKYLLSKIP